MARAFIAVGSNIEPERNVLEALRRLAGRLKVTAVSNFYRSRPVGPTRQPAFVNGVIEVETELSPLDLKYAILRSIEAELGRARSADKYAPRTIDLDLLVYEDRVMATPELKLPDPEIGSRPFLAIPLSELAPELVLPGDDRTMTELAAKFADHDMEPLSAYTDKLKGAIGNES